MYTANISAVNFTAVGCVTFATVVWLGSHIKMLCLLEILGQGVLDYTANIYTVNFTAVGCVTFATVVWL